MITNSAVDKIIDTEWNLTNHYGDGQFGAQTNGIPKISLMMQSLIHLSSKGELGEPWVIMALDGENAFRSMFRHHILEFIAEVCPHNYAFFELMYPPASSVRKTVTHFDGFSVNVERGIQQGAQCNKKWD